MSGEQGNELPPGWAAATLADVGKARMGKTILAKELIDSGLPVYSAGRENKPWGYVDASDLYFGSTVAVISARGSIGFPKLPRVAPFVCTQTTIAVDFRHRPVAEFYTNWLGTVDWERLISGGSIPMLTVGLLNGQTVPVPPLNEQRRIVAKIEGLQARSDAAKEALDAIPPLLEKFRQSVLAAAFRGDLTKKWREANPDVEPAAVLLERIRDERRRKWQKAHPNKKYVEPKPVDTDGLPELPEGWCWASVEELASLVTKGASPGWQGFGYKSEGIMFIRSQNVGWGELRLDDVAHVPVSLNAHQPRSVIAEADVLVNIVGASIGRVALADDRLVGANTNQAVAIIRLVADGLLPAALKYWMLSPETQRRVHLGKVDVARANYSLTDIATLPVPLPPRAEQRAAVDQIESLTAQYDAVKVLTNAAAEAISVLNHSILAKAFRGELVPQDPNDEPASVLLDRIRQERENGGSKPARKRNG